MIKRKLIELESDCGVTASSFVPHRIKEQIQYLRVRTWPNDADMLELKGQRKMVNKIKFYPEPGEVQGVPLDTYEIIVHHDGEPLISSWMNRLELFTGHKPTPCIAEPQSHAFPAQRLTTPGGVQTLDWIPKNSGFIRYASNYAGGTHFHVQLHRYCNSAGTLSQVHAAINPFNPTSEFAGQLGTGETGRVAFVYAGIKYRITLTNVHIAVIDVKLEVSTERRSS